MDLFTVNQDGSQGPQVHDFNPGIPTSGPSAGLFWTAHVPMDSIEVDLGRATASMRLTNFTTKDFFTLKNAFLNAIVPPPAGTIPPVDATITLLHRWSGVKARVNVTDFENTDLTTNRRFAGRFIEDTATVEWSATVPSKNFHFKSGPADPSKSSFAEIGRERNGVFFPPGEDG